MSDQTSNLPVPRTPADSYEKADAVSRGRLTDRIRQLEYSAGRVMETPVIGPRGQFMTVYEAKHRAEQITDLIDTEELRGSLRHHRVSRAAKLLTLIALVVVDFPVMLWLASSVFNVDWTDPLGLPLAISVVISVLATGGAAMALYHLGHNQRENKNAQRQLRWAGLSRGARVSLVAAAMLVMLIAVVMFVRVYTEGILSGLDTLAVLLAALVAFVMLISAALVFWTSFRDGSLEQDDLACYSGIVLEYEQVKRGYEDAANDLGAQLQRR